MNKVVLNISGKTYEKTNPTVKDWFDQQDMLMATEGKNIITDKDSAASVIEAVALFLGTTKQEIIAANLELEELIKAYHAIQANIVECFIKPRAPKGEAHEPQAD